MNLLFCWRLFSGMTQSTVMKPGKFTLKDGKVQQVFLRYEWECFYSRLNCFGWATHPMADIHWDAWPLPTNICPHSWTRCDHTHDLSIPVSCRLVSLVLAFKNTPEWEQKGEHVKICRHRNNCADGVSTLKLFYPFLLIIFPPYIRCVKNNWSLKCILQCLQEEIALLFLFVVGGFKIVLGELIW